MLIDWVHSRVPLRFSSFLLELCKFSSVVNLHEDLPHDDEGDASRHDGSDDTEDNPKDVHHLGTLLGGLDPDLELTRLVVVAIDVGEPALVIVQVSTQSLILKYVVFSLLNHHQSMILIKGTLGALLHAPLVHDVHQGPGLEVLALDAGGELVTLAGAGGAVLAVPAAVLALLRLLALTLPALTRAVSGAQLVDVFTVRSDARLVTSPTLA